jgi:FixJ family two-component response regulator
MRNDIGIRLMIAIIDDDLAVREAMQSLLHSLGYVTKVFSSAEEFLRAPDRSKISCIITDVQMPGMNGLALQQRLIADRQTAPVIFITGFPDKSIRERALSAGAHGFLTKPCTEHSLISNIKSALETRT